MHFTSLETENGRVNAIPIGPLADGVDIGELEDAAVFMSRAV
jgi:hypothetical protein